MNEWAYDKFNVVLNLAYQKCVSSDVVYIVIVLYTTITGV